ncbi:type I-C CRISPR-associated protein Cas8c/Csd1 [Paenibacillus filicis]|uniref:Type I-C CRISPR-associated protein Cas8c/Csd1 n=1 Tax=Paenibacillus filicis TaxID=669464 RepID=A0ABU9DCD3_9BACL
MIIQALHQRYLDLSADPDSGVSPLYFSAAKISYVLEIREDGSLASIQDIRDHSGKKKQPWIMNVPEQPSRSSGISPYFLSDKAEYALGHYPVMPLEKDTAKKKGDARKKYEASRELARKVLLGVQDTDAKAILMFYDNWDPAAVREHPALQSWMEELDKGVDTNMVFRVTTRQAMGHESEAVKQAWIRYRQESQVSSDFEAQCLLTGEKASIARTHDKIKGVRNAQAAGASLVSFNFRSAESYGKDSMQSYNSPVSKTAVFGYTTALNHLLAFPRNRIWIGDMTLVFWSGAAAAEELEPFFAQYVDASHVPAEDKKLTSQLQDVLDRARQGSNLDASMVPQGDTPFYILGLAPNNARVAVRFFWQGHFGDLVNKLGQHAADFAIAGTDDRHRDLTNNIFRILAETMRVGGDGKKVGDGPPPLLGGELLRSVIHGKSYPFSLYNLILNRIRADGAVNPQRVSILKAYLNRYMRLNKGSTYLKEELDLALNEHAQEPAYRLGRLFAVLEKAQQEAANNKLNATIKDRYFSSASSNPAAVFPILIKLAQHHMSKSRYGDFRDQEMGEILQGVYEFPAHLDLQRQGIFVIGYYHQKQYFFEQIKAAAEAKKEAAAAAESSERSDNESSPEA